MSLLLEAGVTFSGATGRAQIDEDGTAYYVVLADGADAVTGLSPGTAYDVLFVAGDVDPYLQAGPVSVDITTLTLYAEYEFACFGS